MGHCPHATTCPLYPLFNLKSILEIWKVSYCEADYSRCARYELSQKGQRVLDTLLPNGTHLALPSAGQR